MSCAFGAKRYAVRVSSRRAGMEARSWRYRDPAEPLYNAKTFLTARPGPVENISMKSPTYYWLRGVAATAIFALSLATATAATTNVIFSFGKGEGEYADTDLETDSAGNIYGTTVLG